MGYVLNDRKSLMTESGLTVFRNDFEAKSGTWTSSYDIIRKKGLSYWSEMSHDNLQC